MKKFYRIVDGYLQKGIGTTVPNGCSLDFTRLELDVNGNPYEFYLEADASGFYSKDEVKLQEKADIKIVEDAKVDKNKALDELVITHNTVAYDANGKAIGNMSAVIGIANFKYNQLLANNISAIDAYQTIYKDTKIFWKGYDNQPHEVMIESVCEALELAMLGVSDILGL